MVEWIDWSNVRAVVEYGPGTGVFTRQILSQTRPEARVVAIELNPSFVTSLQTRYPDVRLYQDSVANVKAICRNEEIQEVDAIVSGLPWASFSDDLQLELLRATTSVLKPGGQFVTFAYLQGLLLRSGRRFRRQLRDHFSRVERSRTVWMNLPPAFVYRCRR
jgi:phospholipid N-methyltransferase